MAFCPQCRAEYRPEITHCPVCDVDLVDAESLAPEMTDDRVVALLAAAELTVVAEGTLQGLKPVQDALIASGIPAALRKAEEVMSEMGLFLRLELVVRQEDEEVAGALVREALGGDLSEEMREGMEALFVGGDAAQGGGEGEAEGEEPETLACPACGCTDPLVNGECPECGLYLGEGEAGEGEAGEGATSAAQAAQAAQDEDDDGSRA